jgi:hypothetical protein
VLNKQTISTLDSKELSEIKAGNDACWENLWTLYYCKVVYTGPRPE